MSLPYKIVRCSACDYEEHSVILNFSYVYRDRDGTEFPINRILGVCEDCKKVVPLENFPDPKKYAEAEEAFGYSPIRKCLVRLFRWRDAWTADLVDEALRQKSGFSALKSVTQLGRSPVCLTCGSADVVALNEPWWDELSTTEPAHTGHFHPGCGGEFLVTDSGGMRISVIPMKMVYDVRGQMLAENHGI